MISHGTVHYVEYITKGNVSSKSTQYAESLYVASDKEVIAQFLKLMDDFNAGLITKPGLQVVTVKPGSIRIEKTWTVNE